MNINEIKEKKEQEREQQEKIYQNARKVLEIINQKKKIKEENGEER